MTLTFIRPPRLRRGSKVAALSLSSGLVSEVPHRYEAGVREVARHLGWEVVPAPNAFRGPDSLYANPQARADDLHWRWRTAKLRECSASSAATTAFACCRCWTAR